MSKQGISSSSAPFTNDPLEINGQAFINADLESGVSKSVYGKPPFILIPNNLSVLDVYYEGNKLWDLPPATKVLKLIPRTF